MVVTVIGLGFVGLTTALGFAENGHKVYGIEVDKEKLSAIKNLQLPFYEPDLEKALKRHSGNNFLACSNIEDAVSKSDFIYYCVGTPFGLKGEADLSDLYNAILQTIPFLSKSKFQVLVIKSTIPPATTKTKIIPLIEEKGVKVGEHLGIANNPEFLREGHCWEDFIHSDRIILGVSDEETAQMLKELYSYVKCPIHMVSLNTAEFIKYLSNTSLALLISYANEMSMAADAIGDINIADAFHILHEDKRWSTGTIRSYFYPGCGYGGYCLPKDTNAFYTSIKDKGFDAQILKNVITTNDLILNFTIERIQNICNNKTDTVIGILGLSFKPESNDVRDTPAAKIINKLNQSGYNKIIAYDPEATQQFKQKYDFKIEYESNIDSVITKSNILVIVTAWSEFKDIKSKTNKPIIDCRYML